MVLNQKSLIKLLVLVVILLCLISCDLFRSFDSNKGNGPELKENNIYLMDETTGFGGRVEELSEDSWLITSRTNKGQLGCKSVKCSKAEVKLYQEFCNYECLRHYNFDIKFEQIPVNPARWVVLWQTMSYMTKEGNPPPVALWYLPDGYLYLRVYYYPSHLTQSGKYYKQHKLFEIQEGISYNINIDLLQTNRTGNGWVDIMVDGTMLASEEGFNTFDSRVSKVSSIQWGIYHAGEHNTEQREEGRYVLRVSNMDIRGY